jgi:hypothetical protein
MEDIVDLNWMKKSITIGTNIILLGFMISIIFAYLKSRLVDGQNFVDWGK